MEPAIRIIVQSQKLQIVIAFDKDEIRIYEIPEQIPPTVEIGRNDRSRVPIRDNKTISRIKWIMRHFKGAKGQIAYSEISVAERLESKRAESVSVVVFLPQLRQTSFVKPHRYTLILEDSERIIADMVAVHVRNDERVDVVQSAHVVPEYLSGSFHGTKTTVNEHTGAIGPEREAVALAAAPQALEVKRHRLNPFLALFESTTETESVIRVSGNQVVGIRFQDIRRVRASGSPARESLMPR